MSVDSPRISAVVHGHFYQPPREEPWTGRVPEQKSAAPFHDWNERIEAECYAPVTRARVLDSEGGVRREVNAFELMSFDVGPTLLAWLEQHAPGTYGAILEGDRWSCDRLDGHGNALAMPFHHTILPLASERDLRTEIRWGIADFRRRFEREPEGMWLPEAAVDGRTLEALAAEGIRFTVLAPHQVRTVPAGGRPGKVVTPAGEIAVFVYDGALSHAVAFGDLIRDGVTWADTMAAAPDPGVVPTLRSMCTDGETFGHHHEFGEMALAVALDRLEANTDVRLESFASFLARHPPTEEVELVEPSSWSCSHGVERWRSACGCRAAPEVESSQAWRAPLRAALEWLAARLHERFEAEATPLLVDPWGARDSYGAVVGAGPPTAGTPAVDDFFDAALRPDVDLEGRARAAELLEMERDALRLFTSCAWFFDDVARLEPRQILAYAAHALELAGEEGLGADLEERLEAVRANDPADGTAAELFRAIVDRRETASA